MKILTVCGMGSGSSLILKMNVDSILNDLDITADVEVCDLGSAKGTQADLIISTTGLKNQLEDIPTEKIFITNVINKEELKDALTNYLNK
ncbi:PTS sugar transporter subunit IIB [Vagococcus elongatus]|uniref:PTS lactose transporter subunit IIB n=1 Tax=Vagococcus elongatus TaxID=180344 RepID=A0A430B0Y3_9ENTE|nr:PTS sugar transporter subunit IIB [Vagococcus elongatus]RSU14007.1 PTS lactose transporter subunit IIB [Vagococcus elongatus]